MAVLGLRFCARAFSSCGKRGPLFIAVRGPLTIVASLVAEHRLQTRRLSSCGSRAQLLRGMGDLPRPGLEPVSPALAGRFSTTVSPGKPSPTILNKSSDSALLSQMLKGLLLILPQLTAIFAVIFWQMLFIRLRKFSSNCSLIKVLEIFVSLFYNREQMQMLDFLEFF